MSESVQLEGTTAQEVGLVIEAAEREIDAMHDLDMEGADQYIDAYQTVKESFGEYKSN